MAGEIASAFVLIRPNASGFRSSLSAQTRGVGEAVGGNIGKAMGLAIGGAVLAAGVGIGLATKLAVGFDRSMRNVNSIAQLSESSFKALSGEVLALGKAAGVAPQTLADGLYDVVSSGFKAGDAMKILTAGAKAAKAGLTSAATATGAVTAVLNAYHLKASQAGKVSDQLFKTVEVGVINFDELASQIGDVLPFAASLDIGLDQVGASIATMTKQGISGAETMTRIKAVMTQFLSPSKDLTKAFKEQGFASGEAMIESLGFQGALDKLAESTGGSKTEMAKLFPDIRALGGALALTGKNSQTAASDLAALKEALGSTGRAADEQAKSISQKWSKMTARLQADGIIIGTRVFPVLEFGLDKVGDFVGEVERIINKAFGPQLDGKPITFKASAQIVWKEVAPQLEAAASNLWSLVQSGIGAAWEAAVGSDTLTMPALPAFKPPEGGQTAIPTAPTFTATDPSSKGPLTDWWEANGAPLVADFQGHGKETGDGFLSGLGESIRENMPNVLGSALTAAVEAPMQLIDGIMRGDFERIWQGIGSISAIQGAIAQWAMELGPPLQQLGKDINDKIVDGIHAAPGAIQDAGKWVNDKLVAGMHAGGGQLQSAGSWVGGQIADAVRDGLSPLGDIGGWVGDKLAAIRSAQARAFSLARGVGGRIVDGVASGASSLGGRVTGLLGQVGSALVGYAGAAAGAAYNIGSSIVSGIISGAAGLAGRLRSAVTSAISSALSNIDIPGLSPVDHAAAEAIGRPLMVGAARGVDANKKLLKLSLTTAAKEALVEAKQNLASIGDALGSSIGDIIDAQVKKRIAAATATVGAALGPMRAQLAAMQAEDAAAQNADTRAGLTDQLSKGAQKGETAEAYMARIADVRKQLAALDRKAAEDELAAQIERTQAGLDAQIDAINTEADARKESVNRSIADLTAAFNAGLISGKDFSAKLAGIMKANGASFSQAGQLLGFAFAEKFRAEVAGISSQIIALAKVLGMKGGTTGGAGFGVDVTDPLATIREQRGDRIKDLTDHRKQLSEDMKALRDARKTTDTKDDKKAQAAIDRDRAAIKRDEVFIGKMDAIIKAAKGITIGQLTVAGAANEAALLKALGDLAAAATR